MPISPLPWTHDEYGHIRDAKGEYVALIGLQVSTLSGGQGRVVKGAQANTDLFFAAPDLLAACQSVMFLLGPSTSFTGQTEVTVKLVEAALAKAKGEPQ